MVRCHRFPAATVPCVILCGARMASAAQTTAPVPATTASTAPSTAGNHEVRIPTTTTTTTTTTHTHTLSLSLRSTCSMSPPKVVVVVVVVVVVGGDQLAPSSCDSWCFARCSGGEWVGEWG